jgi:hypothetical protein
MKKIYTLLILVICSYGAKAQLPENVKAEVEIQAIGTTSGTVPFWMRSNQYGSVPLSGASGSVVGRYVREYKFLNESPSGNDKNHLFDFGYGAEIRANGGKNSNIQIIEAYAKAKAWIFQLKAGRSKDNVGFNGDTTLSSGNFVISGNAIGIPKVELSIPNYWSIPGLNGVISIKGSFAHGWVGHSTVAPGNSQGNVNYTVNAKTYLHQKSIYFRLGKEDWRLKLYGGINHVAYWGDEKKVYGSKYTLSPLETFGYTVIGKAYHAPGIPGSKIGNQLGSIDVGLDYNFDNILLTAYRQFFYDIGGLYHLANLRDGLNGVSVTNKKFKESNSTLKWRALLVELFYSNNQGGEVWSKPTPSGPEDYYNNYYYRRGWSYQDVGLGNPFITPRNIARNGQAYQDYAFFINNRVIAIHGGFEGSIDEWNIKLKTSFSSNNGTFNTSKASKLTGDKDIYRTENIFQKVNQFSIIAETGKFFDNNLYYGASIAYDQGGLLNNSIGLIISAKKAFK